MMLFLDSLFGQQMTVQPQFPPAMTNFGTNAFMTPVNQGFPPQMTVPVMSNVASQFGAVPGNPMGSNGMPNPSMGLPAQMVYNLMFLTFHNFFINIFFQFLGHDERQPNTSDRKCQ